MVTADSKVSSTQRFTFVGGNQQASTITAYRMEASAEGKYKYDHWYVRFIHMFVMFVVCFATFILDDRVFSFDSLCWIRFGVVVPLLAAYAAYLAACDVFQKWHWWKKPVTICICVLNIAMEVLRLVDTISDDGSSAVVVCSYVWFTLFSLLVICIFVVFVLEVMWKGAEKEQVAIMNAKEQ